MTEVVGVGPQHERASLGTDPRGRLVFDYLPTDLQNAEDSTQAADRERLVIWRKPKGFERDATETEKLLLEHLGYTVPEGLQTFVKWPTRGVRRREWPALGV